MESIDRFFVETSSERSSRVKQLPSDISPKHNLLIVGCGLIGREHMRVATLLGRARIHGIYDINKASLDTAESTSELTVMKSSCVIKICSLRVWMMLSMQY